jgi:squalene-associated FAD-dependent desaturase
MDSPANRMNASPRVAILGAGLAGIAASAALGSAGFTVDLFEARPFPGGRATSWPVNGADGEASEVIDNCQHVLLRCCVNLLDLYRRLGVQDKIRFEREYFFIEPGGRMSVLKRGVFPAPAHFAGSFFSLSFLDLLDKIAIARAMRAIPREFGKRRDLDQITMLDWLHEKEQTPNAIERYWRQVLVSAVNEELDRMAAAHGLQVFWLGMLARSDSYEMGLAAVPLRELYDETSLVRAGNVRVHHRAPITTIERTDASRIAAIHISGERVDADYFVSCLPFERLHALMPELPIEWSAFEHSPITGIHLWFDRPITDLPHATLLDRTIQWMFNKSEGRYIQLVVSASRSLTAMPRADVIDLALRELAEFFPAAKNAVLEKAHVIKEVRATFSALPGLEAKRPAAVTRYANLFLAGDWTRSGWPATMEGAVRSGYIAAEAVARAAGRPRHFLIPDIA